MSWCRVRVLTRVIPSHDVSRGANDHAPTNLSTEVANYGRDAVHVVDRDPETSPTCGGSEGIEESLKVIAADEHSEPGDDKDDS